MKILITTKDYLPSLGGLQTMAKVLLNGFQDKNTKLLTQTAEITNEDSKSIIRRASLWKTIRLYLWADVILLNHISIRYGLLAILLRKKYVVSMSGWVGDHWFYSKIFRWILKKASCNISACKAVQIENQVESTIIPNPYNDSLFFDNYQEKKIPFLFAGRLTVSKGVLDLVEVWKEIALDHGEVPLLIAGSGEELLEMKRKVNFYGLQNVIQFVGSKTQTELSDLLNKTDFFLIPSNYHEPIGIVCLEAIACGCIPIGSDGGGLADSIGPCGLIFKRANLQDFKEKIKLALSLKEEDKIKYRSFKDKHLIKFKPKLVVEQYFKVLLNAVDIYE